MGTMLVAGWFYLLIGLGAATVAHKDTSDLGIGLMVILIWPLLLGMLLAQRVTGR